MRTIATISVLATIALTAPVALAQVTSDQCKVTPFRADALDFPSRHAWNLFVWLNHPAVDKQKRRGMPDCTKPIGSPGSTSVWETWRNAATEVYLATEPPAWDDTSLKDEKPGSVPSGKTLLAARSMVDPTSRQNFDERLELSFHGLRGVSDLRPKFSPDDGVFNDRGGFGETRVNKAAYEFIKNECLYNRQGAERYAKAIVANKKPRINFPVESVEVKAAWLDFEKENISLDKQKTFYTAEYNGRKYGLAAFHVITKDIPNWFWASFHHKDSPANKWEVRDSYGQPKALEGTVWGNYVLGGAQIDFVEPTGKPTLLSDHYVEYNFQKSSCIACHATATISTTSSPAKPPDVPGKIGMPSAQARALCLLDPNRPAIPLDSKACKNLAGAHLYDSKGELIEERGSPLAEWYQVKGVETYFQTDFVYSIQFRAKEVEEQGAPPNRCVW